MRRLSLGDLTRFPTLAAYFAQAPAVSPRRQPTSQEHRYAIGTQKAGNQGPASFVGADSIFNIWNPQVPPNGDDSISQMWLSNKSKDTVLQTVEGGWINYPPLYGARSVPFVYYTAHDYDTNFPGCCHPAGSRGLCRGTAAPWGLLCRRRVDARVQPCCPRAR